jgi:cyclophilin family peptidyl-prolyl cis-trans isomerase
VSVFLVFKAESHIFAAQKNQKQKYKYSAMSKTFLTALSLLLGLQLSAQKKEANPLVPAERLVLISTDFGDIKVKLYNETPKSRDNFVKLVQEGFYDSLLFHRVIAGFMIQGGDPESKNAAPGVMLGNGTLGYTVPAEFNDSLFHKKGALCAARTENPEKAGSPCQFYLAQGKTRTDAELDQMEQNINNGSRMQGAFQQIINDPANAALKETFVRMQQTNQRDSINTLVQTTIQPMINAKVKPFKYSPAQRETYKTIGGIPQLDQGYTVFGEVVEGLEVIDKIAAVKTGQADRPVNDVRMKMKMLN